MTEQDYRTADAPSLPVQPAHLPAAPTVAGVTTPAPAATLPTQPVPAQPGAPAAPAAPALVAAVQPVQSTAEVDDAEQAPTEPATEPTGEASTEVDAGEVAAAAQPTRPAVASRRARRPAGGARKVTRYTLDLEAEMHKGLRLFAVSQDVDASKVMRALLWLLMANQELPAGVTLADLVLDEIFGAEDE